MKSWFVYIITNYKNTVLYTGITNDLDKRILEHKQGTTKSAFSKKYRLYKLIWFEDFNSPDEAIIAEKMIKGWMRKKKVELIKKKNPHLKDLSNASLDSSTFGLRMTTRTLLIASNNPGKLKEIKEILSGIPFEVKSLIDIGSDIDVKETGKSFEENAIIKAKTIGEKTGLLTLADDSGLEVDALGGKPGIYSARYGEGSDSDRVNKLLKELKNIPREKRTARFRAVIVLYNPDTKSIHIFEGVSEGYITEKPIGRNGFGYDPIFFNLDLRKTNGEATPEEKNRVSHRARTLIQCKEFLQKIVY